MPTFLNDLIDLSKNKHTDTLIMIKIQMNLRLNSDKIK